MNSKFLIGTKAHDPEYGDWWLKVSDDCWQCIVKSSVNHLFEVGETHGENWMSLNEDYWVIEEPKEDNFTKLYLTLKS